jgi:RNA polymerase sigma factor (sigma-70 family)
MAEPLTRPELLLHDTFVRALARALLGADGEDVAQQTWLRVLQAPPPRGDARAFLAAIVRRLAWNQRRDERRRSARELQAEQPEPTPTPEQVLAREEARRRVVAAVLALDEPFRNVILLRFYEDLAPHTIAQRLGVPPATVRTRLLRALDKLRTQLDGDCGGRAAWAAPLAPLLRPGPDVALPVAVILMKKGLVVAAVAASLLVALLVLRPRAPTPPDAAPGAKAVVAAAADSRGDRGPTPADDPRRDVRDLAPSRPPDLDGPYPAARRLAVLRGFAVDDGGRAADGVAVTVRPWLEPLPVGLQIADDRDFRFATTTDGDGAFAFADIVEGPCELVARAADGREGRLFAAASANGRDETLWIELGQAPPEPDEVVVEVLDRDRRPQPGVRVDGCVLSATDGLCDGRGHPERSAVTDAHGLARFRDQRLQCGVFFARTDDGRCGMQPARLDTWQRPWLTITLDAPGAVHGRLLASGPCDLRGARVVLHAVHATYARGPAVGRSTAVEVRGDAFTADGLAAGTYLVTLDSPAGLRLELGPLVDGSRIPNQVAMCTATVAPGAVEELAVRVTAGGDLQGLVVDGDGRPIAGASVEAVLADDHRLRTPGYTLASAEIWNLDSFARATANPQTHRLTVTDSNGGYRLRGLQPLRYLVRVRAPGLAPLQGAEVLVADGRTAELRHVLAPAGVLQVASRQRLLGVAPIGSPERPALFTDARFGVATFPGLPAGRWSVVAYWSGTDILPRTLADVTIVAGRTTWLDLRDRGDPMTLAGRVLAGGAPVAGAMVQFDPARARTDVDGRFTLELGWRLQLLGNPFMNPRVRVREDGIDYSFALPPSASNTPRADLDLELGDHALTVQVLDAAGTPVAARIDLSDRRAVSAMLATEVSAWQMRVQPEGTRIRHLIATEYRVTAHLPSGADVSTCCTVPARAALVLREPAHGDVLVAVDAGGRTVAHQKINLGEWIQDGAAPLDRGLFAGGACWREAVTDDQGTASFAGVRAGDVLVCIGDDAATEQQVHVEPGTATRVQLRAR